MGISTFLLKSNVFWTFIHAHITLITLYPLFPNSSCPVHSELKKKNRHEQWNIADADISIYMCCIKLLWHDKIYGPGPHRQFFLRLKVIWNVTHRSVVISNYHTHTHTYICIVEQQLAGTSSASDTCNQEFII